MKLEMGSKRFSNKLPLYQIFTVRTQYLFGMSGLVFLANSGTTSNRNGSLKTSLASVPSPIFPELERGSTGGRFASSGSSELELDEDEEDGEELLARDPNTGTLRRGRDWRAARLREMDSSAQMTMMFSVLFSLLLLNLLGPCPLGSCARELLTTGRVGCVLSRGAGSTVHGWVVGSALSSSESRAAEVGGGARAVAEFTRGGVE